MALNLPDLGAKLWLLLTESPDVLHSERSPILDYSIIKLGVPRIVTLADAEIHVLGNLIDSPFS
jgi:hypothetical protein